MNKKIAFISAIYGSYETTCKPFVKQSVPTDFICFTNLNQISSNGWIIDNTPYHIINKSKIDNDNLSNSLCKNQHTFNIAKYYKQNFHNIPRLQEYDCIVWLDGTIEITNERTAEYLLEKIIDNHIIAWEHEFRQGSLMEETNASLFDRYTSTFWFNQSQPIQDVIGQYNTYKKDGYHDIGVWVTCFIAFHNKNDKVREFLDFWYLQTLKYTTQDQIGFPYTVYKLNMYPLTLSGKPHSITDFYIKHDHGK